MPIEQVTGVLELKLISYSSSFNMNMDPKEDVEEYMISCLQGGRLYLMKESPDTLPKARRQLKL